MSKCKFRTVGIFIPNYILAFRMINNSAVLSVGLPLFIYFQTYSWLHFHSSFSSRCDAFLMCFLFWHLMFRFDRDSLSIKHFSCSCAFSALHYINILYLFQVRVCWLSLCCPPKLWSKSQTDVAVDLSHICWHFKIS